MFDLGWSEFLIIGIVTLLVVGPKELPGFMRTLGRYLGLIKRQASEFRAQFDEAIRESELDQLRDEVTGLRTGVEESLRETKAQITKEISDVADAVEGKDKAAVEGTDEDKPAAPEVAGGGSEPVSAGAADDAKSQQA